MDCARGLERRATHQGNGRLLFRDGHDRGTSPTIYSGVFDSLSFRTNTDIHWGISVRQVFNCGGYTDYNERRTATTADTPNLDRAFVEIDAKVLGS